MVRQAVLPSLLCHLSLRWILAPAYDRDLTKSLMGPTLYLVLVGARPPMLIGFGPAWQLKGILTQL